MERFETVIATRVIWDPSFVAEVAVLRVRCEQIHKALRIRISRRGKLKAHEVILTYCGGILVRRASHRAWPDVELVLSVMCLWYLDKFERCAYRGVRKIGRAQWVKAVRPKRVWNGCSTVRHCYLNSLLAAHLE